ncbi:transglutaminase-like domain-containing protein [Occultella gossypii]|uniref:Transglutaminase family protein n=1 Tax=Occultella gossypii TaxID=2800820 RepID=A0ABS7SAV5_9MICO|nr:transglutaminase family protein [Occultella gossypii]MBZ2197481.1 transglutaminase family protein [Occultella gossypii]
MRRSVSADLDFSTGEGATQVALLIAVARAPGLEITDELTVTKDGDPVEVVEIGAPHHGVMHLVEFDAATVRGAQVRVRYSATIDGDPAAALNLAPAPSTSDLLTYLRPSRYAESDELLPTARREFRGLSGLGLLDAVASWVRERLFYVPGSSRVTDGAVSTMLHGQGVCRDYAHLVVALLRAMDTPARLTAVYAPGLSPMDFHAVAEAWVAGHWHVVDATGLAPRSSLVRIATGRDAADTAFLSSYGGGLRMGPQRVMATVDGDLPVDEPSTAVRLP